ncbi:MAG TPA: c-type cytochrome [Terriglobales bacterium]
MNWRDQLEKLRRLFFGDPARRFAWASLALTVSLAIAPTKEFFNEWRHYQRQFFNLVTTRPNGDALKRNFESGIHQIWIPEQHVVDRCPTCHLGMKEASLSDVRQRPFRVHPPIPHSLTEFGCVTCHRGQGAATTVEEAHASTKAWEQPLLPARYLEASCGQCHLGPLDGTPKLNLGRQLLAHYGCARCHRIDQPDGSPLLPSDDSPPLGHIAEKTSREWIFAWLKNPQAYAASATMPDFQFSDQQAADVASFLIAQSAPTPGTPVEPAAGAIKSAVDPAQGASLYGTSFCASCHAVQNAAGNIVGGDLGPELTRIGSKVKPEWLARWLKDPAHYDPRTQMPRYRFADQQIGLLTGYLMNKKDDDFLANVHLPPSDAANVERGQKLVAEYGCAACHQINGVGPPKNFAPDLSRIGSKPLAQIAFAPGMGETLPEYIGGKIHEPRAGGSGLKMAKYTLTDAQLEAITTALLAQTDRAWNMPRELIRPAAHSSDNQPGGEAGRLMTELRCQSCHRINGNGGDMAPDLTHEGSAVLAAWLPAFMNNPNTLRPALIRRMPKFNLSAADNKTISDYILSAYQAPGFDSLALDAHSLDAASAVRGMDLFYTKYACQSCHIADYKKDKGYIGPPLAAVGNRRPAVWLYKMLKDPQAVTPGTQMPNPGLTDAEAKDLTAFLVTLKARENGGGK